MHTRYNERLRRQGINIDAFTRHTRAMCDGRLQKRSPEYNVALTAALELVHQGSMVVDDLNSDRTDAVTLFNLRLGWQQTVGAWTLREQLRVDNLTDRYYLDALSLGLMPAPGRTARLSMTLQF